MGKKSPLQTSVAPPDESALFELPPRFAVSKRQQHTYDASRLKEERQDIYHAIVRLSGWGVGQLAIAEALQVSHHLVRVVQEAENCAVAIAREQRSRRNKRLAAMADEAIEERLASPVARREIPVRDLSTVSRNAHATSMELDGEATVRVDVRVSAVPPHDALNAHLTRLRSAGTQALGMGLAGEISAPKKGAAGADAPEAPAPGAEAHGEGAVDLDGVIEADELDATEPDVEGESLPESLPSSGNGHSTGDLGTHHSDSK